MVCLLTEMMLRVRAAVRFMREAHTKRCSTRRRHLPSLRRPL